MDCLERLLAPRWQLGGPKHDQDANLEFGSQMPPSWEPFGTNFQWCFNAVFEVGFGSICDRSLIYSYIFLLILLRLLLTSEVHVWVKAGFTNRGHETLA